MKKLVFGAAITLSTLFIVACGDNKDPRLSDSDIMELKRMKYENKFGAPGTSVTTTSTTSTSTTTVTVNSTN